MSGADMGQGEEELQDSDGPTLSLRQDAQDLCLLAELMWDPVRRSTGAVQVRHQAEGGLQAAGQQGEGLATAAGLHRLPCCPQSRRAGG